ncbi:MAG: UDP-N-acetylglucosamine 2-epimerase (non-hydrolyzing) [Ardenticatenaceae bacterium]|nr:UDP-N-acetylglucosamine 2-epimerase (non-hydrolyzing) [Ardenticatenaceae bacterium]
MKVLCVLGTRPEAIKIAPVITELKFYKRAGIETVVCATGQHREMLDSVLSLFDIIPDYDLDLMKFNQSLGDLTANLLLNLRPVIQREKPDWILVQGDTTTAMVGALAGFYERVKVGHIEAGLRTGDKAHPFPEEINRKIADHICDLHFAPTEIARNNLLAEGIKKASIYVTGNTVIDALHSMIRQPFQWVDSPLAEILADRRIVLVTAHRRENFGEPLENICLALLELVDRYPDIQVVYPVHLNPNVQKMVTKHLAGKERIFLLDPLDYLPFIQLINRSYLVLTDSGGLQEEVPALGKPVLVMRETTERPEAIEAGTARLVGTNRQNIVREVSRLLDDTLAYQQMAQAKNPFGDGHASELIVKAMLAF